MYKQAANYNIIPKNTGENIKDFYLKNSREYVKKLRKLKTDALKEVQNVKGEDVRVATFLGGYNYLLAEFGIDVKAVLEPTHGSQISMASLQKIIEKIKKDKIDIIFGEKNYSDEYVTIIKNETGIEVRKLEHLTTGAYTADSFEKFIKIDIFIAIPMITILTKTIPIKIIKLEFFKKNSTTLVSKSDFALKKLDRANTVKYVITMISLPFSAPYLRINGS